MIKDFGVRSFNPVTKIRVETVTPTLNPVEYIGEIRQRR